MQTHVLPFTLALKFHLSLILIKANLVIHVLFETYLIAYVAASLDTDIISETAVQDLQNASFLLRYIVLRPTNHRPEIKQSHLAERNKIAQLLNHLMNSTRG